MADDDLLPAGVLDDLALLRHGSALLAELDVPA
jgi:hypothetical protein